MASMAKRIGAATIMPKDWAQLHSVSVWASELGLSLAQVSCAEKSNEITAIPEFLQLVDFTGAIITIDAMGTQKAIAKQIVDGKGDYVLALKGNQESLHDAVIDHITTHLDNDFAGIDAQQLSLPKPCTAKRRRAFTRTYLCPTICRCSMRGKA